VTRLAGGVNTLPLGYLYIALVDSPQIYWEARGSPALWARFAEFESMNLGPVSPMTFDLSLSDSAGSHSRFFLNFDESAPVQGTESSIEPQEAC